MTASSALARTRRHVFIVVKRLRAKYRNVAWFAENVVCAEFADTMKVLFPEANKFALVNHSSFSAENRKRAAGGVLVADGANRFFCVICGSESTTAHCTCRPRPARPRPRRASRAHTDTGSLLSPAEAQNSLPPMSECSASGSTSVRFVLAMPFPPSNAVRALPASVSAWSHAAAATRYGHYVAWGADVLMNVHSSKLVVLLLGPMLHEHVRTDPGGRPMLVAETLATWPTTGSLAGFLSAHRRLPLLVSEALKEHVLAIELSAAIMAFPAMLRDLDARLERGATQRSDRVSSSGASPARSICPLSSMNSSRARPSPPSTTRRACCCTRSC